MISPNQKSPHIPSKKIRVGHLWRHLCLFVHSCLWWFNPSSGTCRRATNCTSKPAGFARPNTHHSPHHQQFSVLYRRGGSVLAKHPTPASGRASRHRAGDRGGRMYVRPHWFVDDALLCLPRSASGGRAVLGADGSRHGNDRAYHLGRDSNQIPQNFPTQRVDGAGLCHRSGRIDASRCGHCLDHRCWLRSDGSPARRVDDFRVGGQLARRRNLHTRSAEAAKASAKAFVTASYSAFHTKKRDLK